MNYEVSSRTHSYVLRKLFGHAVESKLKPHSIVIGDEISEIASFYFILVVNNLSNMLIDDILSEQGRNSNWDFSI